MPTLTSNTKSLTTGARRHVCRLCFSLHHVWPIGSIWWVPLIVHKQNVPKHLYVGKHSCLWCEISSNQLKIPCGERPPSQLRSLQSLRRDYDGFVGAGGDVRHAKDFNNVIQPYFFEIPLNQVMTTAIQPLLETIPFGTWYVGVPTWTPPQSRHLLPAVLPPQVRVPSTRLSPCS